LGIIGTYYWIDSEFTSLEIKHNHIELRDDVIKVLQARVKSQENLIDEMEMWMTMMSYYPGSWSLPAAWFTDERVHRVKKHLDDGIEAGHYKLPEENTNETK
jgi:hypothetical protein